MLVFNTKKRQKPNNTIEMRLLQKIEDKIRNKSCGQKLHIQSIKKIVIDSQLRWFLYLFKLESIDLEKEFLKREYWRKTEKKDQEEDGYTVFEKKRNNF